MCAHLEKQHDRQHARHSRQIRRPTRASPGAKSWKTWACGSAGAAKGNDERESESLAARCTEDRCGNEMKMKMKEKEKREKESLVLKPAGEIPVQRATRALETSGHTQKKLLVGHEKKFIFRPLTILLFGSRHFRFPLPTFFDPCCCCCCFCLCGESSCCSPRLVCCCCCGGGDVFVDAVGYPRLRPLLALCSCGNEPLSGRSE